MIAVYRQKEAIKLLYTFMSVLEGCVNSL